MTFEVVADIVELIVDFLRDDKKSLCNSSQISPVWCYSSQRRLFHKINIRLPLFDERTTMQSAMSFFSGATHLNGFVRELTIYTTGNEAFLDTMSERVVDLHCLAKLSCTLPNLHFVFLDEVTPTFNPNDLSLNMAHFRVPHVRRLEVKNVTVHTPDLFSFFSLSHVFPGLEELSLINVVFGPAGRAPPGMAWNMRLVLSKLLVRDRSTVGGAFWQWLPAETLRAVTTLDISLRTFIGSGFLSARSVLSLVNLLNLTLGWLKFPYTQRNTSHILVIVVDSGDPSPFDEDTIDRFTLSVCSKLHSITFLDNIRTSLIDESVNLTKRILAIAPPSTKQVSFVVLERANLAKSIYRLEALSRCQMRDVADNFERIRVVSSAKDISHEHLSLDAAHTLKPAYQDVVREAFSGCRVALLFH
ncbi:hypothetical protein BXZ70DRAFT_205943 [Cristinia sonorae]|uniref:Uncharacterized protein n=1 Tax=Cristinia sonorae TaxID=1940300 RepID=A0A8K0UMR6_9AGAR|nr:hypothetical protein BXZ70DRAFT_205943 [Cristinia sonorae]